MTKISTAFSLGLIFALSGCANVLYFNHSSRISLTIESDPSNPNGLVQGNLGLKERIVLATPGVSSDHSAPGEALSMIGRFQFSNDQQTDGVRIRSAFISGAAAADLSSAQAVEAARAVSMSVSYGPGPSGTCIRSWIEEDDSNARSLESWIEENEIVDSNQSPVLAAIFTRAEQFETQRNQFIRDQEIECG